MSGHLQTTVHLEPSADCPLPCPICPPPPCTAKCFPISALTTFLLLLVGRAEELSGRVCWDVLCWMYVCLAVGCTQPARCETQCCRGSMLKLLTEHTYQTLWTRLYAICQGCPMGTGSACHFPWFLLIPTPNLMSLMCTITNWRHSFLGLSFYIQAPAPPLWEGQERLGSCPPYVLTLAVPFCL